MAWMDHENALHSAQPPVLAHRSDKGLEPADFGLRLELGIGVAVDQGEGLAPDLSASEEVEDVKEHVLPRDHPLTVVGPDSHNNWVAGVVVRPGPVHDPHVRDVGDVPLLGSHLALNPPVLLVLLGVEVLPSPGPPGRPSALLLGHPKVGRLTRRAVVIPVERQVLFTGGEEALHATYKAAERGGRGGASVGRVGAGRPLLGGGAGGLRGLVILGGLGLRQGEVGGVRCGGEGGGGLHDSDLAPALLAGLRPPRGSRLVALAFALLGNVPNENEGIPLAPDLNEVRRGAPAPLGTSASPTSSWGLPTAASHFDLSAKGSSPAKGSSSLPLASVDIAGASLPLRAPRSAVLAFLTRTARGLFPLSSGASAAKRRRRSDRKQK
eukprot:CAMPEP_0197512828 /NCGR_PEP_ID=MMETSP1312-20131121/76996_1 /TAXON_ID=464262 /ORGANISM="Genus nov. species nov., Strain RCC2335" /LENGTH=380 /DNA_ID=CAMNT_0043060941 /DNA_START=230 /DNA_END=1371 /DNA_ORIENTATION=+